MLVAACALRTKPMTSQLLGALFCCGGKALMFADLIISINQKPEDDPIQEMNTVSRVDMLTVRLCEFKSLNCGFINNGIY